MSNAVTARDEPEIQKRESVSAASESAAIIQVIERAALNPNVDIDKMERLLQMQERIVARNAKAAYDAAFAAMQPELPVIGERGGIKDRSGNIQSKYALWEDINEAIKPVLARHGFGISFRTGSSEGRITVTGILSHREGHREETTMDLPHDSSGNKNAVQAVGSSTSYGKRYTAQALLNLTSRDAGERDDDGAAGGAGDAINDDQASELVELLALTKSDLAIFLKFFEADAVENIRASKFQEAKAKLQSKLARQMKDAANG